MESESRIGQWCPRCGKAAGQRYVIGGIAHLRAAVEAIADGRPIGDVGDVGPCARCDAWAAVRRSVGSTRYGVRLLRVTLRHAVREEVAYRRGQLRTRLALRRSARRSVGPDGSEADRQQGWRSERWFIDEDEAQRLIDDYEASGDGQPVPPPWRLGRRVAVTWRVLRRLAARSVPRTRRERLTSWWVRIRWRLTRYRPGHVRQVASRRVRVDGRRVRDVRGSRWSGRGMVAQGDRAGHLIDGPPWDRNLRWGLPYPNQPGGEEGGPVVADSDRTGEPERLGDILREGRWHDPERWRDGDDNGTRTADPGPAAPWYDRPPYVGDRDWERRHRRFWGRHAGDHPQPAAPGVSQPGGMDAPPTGTAGRVPPHPDGCTVPEVAGPLRESPGDEPHRPPLAAQDPRDDPPPLSPDDIRAAIQRLAHDPPPGSGRYRGLAEGHD